jgi:hypothetical protein
MFDAKFELLDRPPIGVVVHRVGSAPLDQCTVSSVRPGQTYSRTDSGAPGHWR